MTVATTAGVGVVASMTDSVSPGRFGAPKLVTQTWLPSGLTATPAGPSPTATVATTAGVGPAVSITDTVLPT